MQLREEDVDHDDAYLISREMFRVFDEEMRCAICLSVYREPVALPCYHVYCHGCVTRQATEQKTLATTAQCAECKTEFSDRELRAAKELTPARCVKLRKLLDVYRSIRRLNQICSQEEVKPEEAVANHLRRSEGIM